MCLCYTANIMSADAVAPEVATASADMLFIPKAGIYMPESEELIKNHQYLCHYHSFLALSSAFLECNTCFFVVDFSVYFLPFGSWNL